MNVFRFRERRSQLKILLYYHMLYASAHFIKPCEKKIFEFQTINRSISARNLTAIQIRENRIKIKLEGCLKISSVGSTDGKYRQRIQVVSTDLKGIDAFKAVVSTVVSQMFHFLWSFVKLFTVVFVCNSTSESFDLKQK